jgi:hypothetical protein
VLHDLLSLLQAAKIGAVTVDRLSFGCNGHRHKPDGHVLQEYTERLVNLGAVPSDEGKLFVYAPAVALQRGAHVPPELVSPFTSSYANRVPWRAENHTETFEPFRMHHYLTRSFEECLSKVNDPRLASLKTSWRHAEGDNLCKRHMEGETGFYRIEHAHDYTLARSPLARITGIILRSLELSRIKCMCCIAPPWRDQLEESC